MKPMLRRENNNNVLKTLSIFFCMVFVIAGILFIYQGVENYREQLRQQDWPEAEAFVTQVKSRKESSGVRKNRTKTVYDVEYIFDVPPMDTYYGNIKGTAIYYETGEMLTIKYDPNDPNTSTTVLAPNLSTLLTNTVLSILFTIVPVIVVFVIPRLDHDVKEKLAKPRKPYSKKDPSVRGYPIKLVLMAIVSNLNILGVGLFAIGGLLFILFAILAKHMIVFYIAGSIALLIYLKSGVISPIMEINRFYNELGSEQFHRIIDKALESSRGLHNDYEEIMSALGKACPSDEND